MCSSKKVLLLFLLLSTCGGQTSRLLKGSGRAFVVSGPAFPSIANLSARWEADCITFASSVCGVPSNGSTLTTWADESGNGNTATVAGGTCTFNTNQQNSRPAITFSSCWLTLTGINYFSSGQTAFVVTKVNSTSQGGAWWSGAHNASITWKAATKENTIDNTTASNLGQGTANADISWHQLGINYGLNCTSSFTSYRRDQVDDGSGSGCPNPTTQTTIGRNAGGNNEALDGKLAALIIYSRLLTSTERNQVENYLYCKYAVGAGPCT